MSFKYMLVLLMSTLILVLYTQLNNSLLQCMGGLSEVATLIT